MGSTYWCISETFQYSSKQLLQFEESRVESFNLYFEWFLFPPGLERLIGGHCYLEGCLTPNKDVRCVIPFFRLNGWVAKCFYLKEPEVQWNDSGFSEMPSGERFPHLPGQTSYYVLLVLLQITKVSLWFSSYNSCHHCYTPIASLAFNHRNQCNNQLSPLQQPPAEVFLHCCPDKNVIS